MKLLLISLFFLSQYGQAKTSTPYTVTKLKNGLEVIAMESHKVPLVKSLPVSRGRQRPLYSALI